MSDNVSVPLEASVEAAVSGRRGLLHRVVTNPFGLMSLVIIAIVVLVAVFANVLAPHDPTIGDLTKINKPPGEGLFLGGDGAGRDVLSRLLFGTRSTLIGVVICLSVGLIIGVSAGLVAGYRGGKIDVVANWVAEVFLVLPAKIFLVALFALIGPRMPITMAFLGVLVAPGFFRLTRNQVNQVKKELYVDAARVSGLGDLSIVGRHIFSVVRSPIVIQAAFTAGTAIILQASLEFIGLGDGKTPSWGGMLLDAYNNLYQSRTLVIWPGLAIALTTAAFILLGNAMQDAMGASDVPVIGKTARARIVAEAAEVRATQRPAPASSLLSVQNLGVGYGTTDGDVSRVVQDVSFHVNAGEVLGIVGESGSGKTQTALAIMRLLPPGGQILAGRVFFEGADLSALSSREMRTLRGRRIGYVPQEPMSNLDPTFKIGSQLTEPLRHDGLSRREARDRALELLEATGISDPLRVFNSYPHQISGGMAQRVLIAGAVSRDPALLIADEPTTAVDVTVQAEILDILRDLQKERQMGVVLVTHNFGVVADLCDRVAVMQRGVLVEEGDVAALFASPQHPYTQMLLGSTLEGTPGRRVLDERVGAHS